LFDVKTLTTDEYQTSFQGANRVFRGENYYTILVAVQRSVTLAEFAYEAIKMSRLVFNYHCTDFESKHPVESQLTIFDHENRVYHE
jgi:hypothetical protein